MGKRHTRPMDRRQFLARGTLGTLGAGMTLSAAGGVGALLAAQEPKPKRIRKDGMVYRRLGRTELMVSELGMGGSPNPEPPIFTVAVDRGVNYTDSSAGYSRGNSERNIGAVVKGRRDKVVISTKFHPHRFEDDVTAKCIEATEAALERIQTDYIDIMCVHGASDPQHPCLNDEVLAAFEQLKKDGKIRFVGVSNHKDPANVLPPIIESGHYDVVLLAFNAFSGTKVTPEDIKAGKVYDNWLEDSGLQRVLDLAMQHDVGLVAMKSRAGGDRQSLEGYKVGETTLMQAKLKWILSHEAVASVLSEMLNFDILKENLAAAGTTLTAQEQAMLREHVLANSADVCRMCATCVRACPRNVPIPDILRYVMYHDEHGKVQRARRSYRRRVSAGTFASCSGCDACVRACPHRLDIKAKLAYAHSILA
jgi:predicted aldo/keto reductase-like oxidoreductase